MRASIKGVDFPEKWESVGDAYATHDGVIHLKRKTFNIPTFQHECAHILTFSLESGGSANDTSFESRWRTVAGEVYGRYVVPDTEYSINPGWSDNGVDNGPRHGCVRPYGAKNFYEDVATFVEKVWGNPDFFSSLIDPKSSQYEPRYKQKLNLLLEYGFITQEQYDRIVGAPAKKIDTVK